MLKPIIVALDFPTYEEAKVCVDTLESEIDIFKVGLELFLNSRGKILDYIHSKGREVFLDLKFHDIPNTTEQAAKFAVSQNVFLFNVHASGGREMMRRVAKITREESSSKVIGVTMLTSLENSDVEEMFLTSSGVKEVALELAKLAHESNLHGVVCSPHEAASIKAVCGDKFLTVCPGIRLDDGNLQDQKRVATPRWAVKNGVDFMVIGRPITQSLNPLETIKKIYKDMGYER